MANQNPAGPSTRGLRVCAIRAYVARQVGASGNSSSEHFQRRFRGGKEFRFDEHRTIPLSELTAAQADAIRADEALEVTEVDIDTAS